MKNILPLFALMLAVACSSKPKNNSVSFIETSGEVNAKLKDIPPENAQYEFEGYKVPLKECSFLKTIYLELTPPPTGNFEKSLKKRIDAKAIMGLAPKKRPKQSNPCSRVALYSSIKSIRMQGSKNKFDDKGFLAKGILGITSDGQAYLELTFYEKLKKDQLVKSISPGYFLTYENAHEMTDDELADWLAATLYHVGWK